MGRAGLELLTIGRVGVDLYAQDQGVGFTDARTFAKSIGGSPTNVAVAAARLGRRSAVFTAVGDDEPGRYVRHALAAFGVDTRFVGIDDRYPTPLVLAAMETPDEPWFAFYREPKAPDAELQLDAMDLEVVRSVPILWVSAGSLAQDPSRSTVVSLLDTRARSRHVVLDLDYRPSFWTSEGDASQTIGAAVARATIAVGNERECEVAVGRTDPDSAAEAMLEQGVEIAIVKLGARGVLVATADERTLVPAVKIDVVSGLGAGDAFGGAFCHQILAGRSPVEAVRFANAAGAIVAARLLCADAMPTEREVLEVLEAQDL